MSDDAFGILGIVLFFLILFIIIWLTGVADEKEEKKARKHGCICPPTTPMDLIRWRNPDCPYHGRR